MNKNLKIIIGILIVLLVVGAIYMYYKLTTQNEPKEESPTDNKTYNFKAIESLPEDYTLDQAVEDNCVVLTNNEKIYNKDELDRFIQNVNNNIPDFMRVVCFTVEGDMIITDIKFNNENNFKVCFDYTRDEYSSPEDRIYRYGKYTEFGEEKTEDGIYYYLDKPEDENLHKVYIAGYENDTEIINKKDSVK